MTDYISRQAAIDVASGYCHSANIAKELAKLPTADVIEVVRCKDCKHGDKSHHYTYYRCTYMNKWNTADGFCCCGEVAEQ